MRVVRFEDLEAWKSTHKGFTLIELMLVVIIISVLAAMVVPRFVGRSEEARLAVARADVDAHLATALDLYEMDIGRYPNELKELRINPGLTAWKGPYLKKDPKDPWKRDYEYTLLGSDGKDYKLCSKGPDESKPDDDICNQ
ncbi:MAG: type II secretion system major pseudopilin GspG [Candidatus Omnitrophica bacterium]|nr:type II secretion system major pseudopilin GspG [Candidatus Omnitrophota bacterium]